MSTGLAQSVQTRLVRHAKTIGVDPNLVLARYATERLLYRLSQSPHVERFVLKGALLLLVWMGETIRPTRDADLLGFGELDVDALARTFAEVVAIPVEPDGLVFDTGSIRVAAIRPEDAYGGQRVTLLARLGQARLRVQVDVGIGDAVTPDPVWLDYPTLLDLPRPRLRAYRPETAIAEKVHAMVVLGSKNSRMRDFFDVHALATRESFDGEVLAGSVASTFSRRRTEIAAEPPIALTAAFAEEEGKRAQWAGFVRKNRLAAAPVHLEAVIEGVADFIGPVLAALARRKTFVAKWQFLAYAMNSRIARWQIEIVLSGGSGLANNIAQQVVKDLVVAQPRQDEQRAIVAFLDRETARIDALVAKVGDAIEHLTELRTALISAAVTGKIDVRAPDDRPEPETRLTGTP